MTSYFYKMTINVHQTNIAMCVPEILLAIVIDRKRSFSHKKIEPAVINTSFCYIKTTALLYDNEYRKSTMALIFLD